MTLQTGVGVSIGYKPETTFGTAPGASGAQLIRNVSSGLNLSKDTYQSNERRSDFQVQEFKHGVRRVGGDIQGEMSLGSYDDFIAAVMRGTWDETPPTFIASAGVGVTVDNTLKTLTRASGSWITDGFKIGHVIQASGLHASIDGTNLRIAGLTATAITTAEAPGTDVAVANEDCTIAVVGKTLIMPTVKADIMRRSFAFEHVYEDVDFSQLFTGVRIGRWALALPPTGISTCTFGTMGQDMTICESAQSPYFTAPTDPTSTAVLAAVDGTLRVGSSDVGVITGLNIDLNLNLSADPVVGRNTVPEVFYGRSIVTGSMTAFLEGGTLLKNFVNEDEINIHAYVAVPGSSNFLSVFLPRIKFTGGEIQNQGEQGLPINLPFQALLKADGGTGTAYDKTTMALQILNA